MSGARTPVALAAICGLIALADLAQVALLGKGVGALGGALIYGFAAALAWRRRLESAWLVLAMPLIPIAVFTGLLGAPLRDRLVDPGMLAVFGLQLGAALTAATWIRAESVSS